MATETATCPAPDLKDRVVDVIISIIPSDNRDFPTYILQEHWCGEPEPAQITGSADYHRLLQHAKDRVLRYEIARFNAIFSLIYLN